jgi:ADP-heptose:LPS heptosyltransferase
MKPPFRYRLDKKIRALLMRTLGLVTARLNDAHPDWKRQRIKNILLVRGIFRLGDSILAMPAIFLFRRNFPNARIDFVGPPVSEPLFQNLPINRYYRICRGLPEAFWAYWVLLRQIRSVHYDLAVDVSGSKAAMGAFLVGFSDARLRVGLQGRWDRWFNVRLPRPAEKNKYRTLPALVAAMGLETQEHFLSPILSTMEKQEGKKRVEAMTGQERGPTVGVFAGGRETRGKRWPKENFLELIEALRSQGIKTITFLGPEEKDLMGFFRRELPLDIPLVFEPSLRIFAAIVSNCDLFVGCDSGPIHLACALHMPTVVIFLKNNFNRWGPPPSLGRIVYRRAGASVHEVLEACLLELAGGAIRSQAPGASLQPEICAP